MAPQRPFGLLLLSFVLSASVQQGLAQDATSAETPIDRLRREIRNLEGGQCDAERPAAIREEFGELAKSRRSQLSLLLEQQIAELRNAPLNAEVKITEEDQRIIGRLVAPLQAEVNALQSGEKTCGRSKQKSSIPTKIPTASDGQANLELTHGSTAPQSQKELSPISVSIRKSLNAADPPPSTAGHSANSKQTTAVQDSTPPQDQLKKDAGASTSTSTPACEPKTAPYFPELPVAERKVLYGCAMGTTPIPEVRLVVYQKGGLTECPANPPALSDPDKAILQNVPASVDSKTGVFFAELKNPLSAGLLICIWPASSTPTPPVVVAKWGYEESETPIGRTRYYFATGVELSQSNQQFSNQDIYVAFDLDRNWIRGTHNALLNSEFSARLAAIPVAASSTTSTATTTSEPSTSTFISSRKAGMVQGAIYAPLYANAFKGWFGGGTTAFLAPLVEGGLQTITSGALSASTPAPGTTTTTATVNGAGLYYFWGAGIRLGDLRLYRSWNIAPQILSHLDLTFGRWENFKQCRSKSNCTPGANGAVPDSQLYQPLMLALQGEINVPKTPVMIGFSSINPIPGGGQGDLRFYFGVKLDVGCVYNAFKGGSTPKFFDCADEQNKTTPNKAQTPSAGQPAAGATSGRP